jgi:GTPase
VTPANDANYQVRNLEVEEVLREMAGTVSSRLPAGWGMALFLFEFGENGTCFYISDAQREDMVRMLREWIQRNTH